MFFRTWNLEDLGMLRNSHGGLPDLKFKNMKENKKPWVTKEPTQLQGVFWYKGPPVRCAKKCRDKNIPSIRRGINLKLVHNWRAGLRPLHDRKRAEDAKYQGGFIAVKVGPLPVISKVITPFMGGYSTNYPCIRPFIIGVITPFLTSRGPPCTE